MVNLVLSFYKVWSTLSYLFMSLRIDLPLGFHRVCTRKPFHNQDCNHFVNKYEFFKSTPMIFLSTSTANENSHQHQLQPINTYIIDFSHWVDYFSYLTPFILSTEVKWLSSPPPQATTLECCFGDPKTCMSRLQKRYFFSRLLVWHSPKDRSSGVLNLNVLSVLLQAEKHFNIVQTFKMFEKKKAPPKTNEALTCYRTILFLQNG